MTRLTPIAAARDRVGGVVHMSLPGGSRWASRPWIALTVLAVGGSAALELGHLPGVLTPLLATCAGWVTLAVALELLSIAGFAVVFKLVFGPGMSWRQTAVGALRGLGASNVLPAGGLIGPAAAASSVASGRRGPNTMGREGSAFGIRTH